jgi:hypothetical protein
VTETATCCLVTLIDPILFYAMDVRKNQVKMYFCCSRLQLLDHQSYSSRLFRFDLHFFVPFKQQHLSGKNFDKNANVRSEMCRYSWSSLQTFTARFPASFPEIY